MITYSLKQGIKCLDKDVLGWVTSRNYISLSTLREWGKPRINEKTDCENL